MSGTVQPSVVSVCDVVAPCVDLKFLAIFLYYLMAQGLGQFVLKFSKKLRDSR